MPNRPDIMSDELTPTGWTLHRNATSADGHARQSVDAATTGELPTVKPAADASRAPSRRKRRLIGVAVSVVLTLGLLGLAAVSGRDGRASALVGHPEVLRQGCSWSSSGNYVQNCKVWSASQKKYVIVQIRASNGSNRGVYLLDGMRARDDRSAWTTDVQAAKVYDSTSDTTLVMPAGGASSFYTDWDGGAGKKKTPIKEETFLTQELPAYLGTNFGVSKSNNAIVGLSMSAAPAVTLAERHPDQFKVVQAMSGYYQTDNPLGALGVAATQTLVSNYTNGILNMWGAPGSGRWKQNDASKNVDKLKKNGQVLIISSGNGILTPGELAKLAPQDQISAVALEMLSAVSTVLMQLQLGQSGVSVISLPNYGGHTWQNWNRGLGEGKNHVLEALNKTPPVTAKTQLVDPAGAPDPQAVTNAANAARTATQQPPVLPEEITDPTSDWNTGDRDQLPTPPDWPWNDTAEPDTDSTDSTDTDTDPRDTDTDTTEPRAPELGTAGIAPREEVDGDTPIPPIDHQDDPSHPTASTDDPSALTPAGATPSDATPSGAQSSDTAP
ncbi:MAG: alpha/beta hydrolase family protein, partial [Gordonia sp. (in: high G+C Gram-positive bacteria)]